MKAVSVALKAHMAGVVTTLAVCWRIVRLDGMVYAFTAFDEDLVISGTTYLSTAGFSRTAIQTGSTGQVDNLEVLGFFSADGITRQDIKNQLFDHARIYVFAVNWADLSQGIIRLRTGWLGETTVSPSGAFMAELRGLTQALVQEFGDVWQPLCRNDLGDSHCKIPIAPAAWTPSASHAVGDYVSPATKSSDALKVAIFVVTTAGSSGGSEPTWNTTVGGTTTDGSIIWTSMTPYRLIASVVTPQTAHSFISSGLSMLALRTNIGSINVVQDVPAGVVIQVSDGVSGDTSVDLNTAISRDDAAAKILAQLQGSALNMTYAVVNGLYIALQNNSGGIGSIVKTGDPASTIVIDNFMQAPLNGGALTWITGLNAGVTVELKTYDSGTAQVNMWLGMLFAIQAGDTFYYYPGCDKRRDTCTKVFDNILNNRSEPDMVGTDQMLAYPDS